MSKLLENKQIIHIATEIVVLIGLTFYFSSKNKKLMEHIEDLSQRLEDQEDLIQKHEQIIRQLVQAVNTNQQPPSSPTPQPKPKSKKSKRDRTAPIPVTVHFNDNEVIEETIVTQVEESSGDDSDLDNEIAEELQELQQQQEGLKKRN
mgnify:CR=1 FL=1